ncbi:MULTISPECIES: hypothetical protein [Nostoc]|uniref:Uncharacterized protein n=1 Tax=Nostoc paludosum FACHB-159 TaxID=2692908 RepID=A0ABR8KLH1_9NOSO|nr:MULTISPECIES: hypothetical protein [Nostoc]MBD2683236.1 hypothetical protein [Nostoc sp. FACHB-857]MBD2739563.1 hypothetical protein [Nostoc paludosum FACHB-159]
MIKMNAQQKALFNRLNPEQRVRLLQVLEHKQYLPAKGRVNQARKVKRLGQTKQVTGGIALDKGAKGLGDAVSITSMYGSQID